MNFEGISPGQPVEGRVVIHTLERRTSDPWITGATFSSPEITATLEKTEEVNSYTPENWTRQYTFLVRVPAPSINEEFFATMTPVCGTPGVKSSATIFLRCTLSPPLRLAPTQMRVDLGDNAPLKRSFLILADGKDLAVGDVAVDCEQSASVRLEAFKQRSARAVQVPFEILPSATGMQVAQLELRVTISREGDAPQILLLPIRLRSGPE